MCLSVEVHNIFLTVHCGPYSDLCVMEILTDCYWVTSLACDWEACQGTASLLGLCCGETTHSSKMKNVQCNWKSTHIFYRAL